MKKVKITNLDIGRWVTVKWDDVGRRDSLLIEILPFNGGTRSAKVYEPYGKVHTVDMDQIIEKRGYVSVG